MFCSPPQAIPTCGLSSYSGVGPQRSTTGTRKRRWITQLCGVGCKGCVPIPHWTVCGVTKSDRGLILTFLPFCPYLTALYKKKKTSIKSYFSNIFSVLFIKCTPQSEGLNMFSNSMGKSRHRPIVLTKCTT